MYYHKVKQKYQQNVTINKNYYTESRPDSFIDTPGSRMMTLDQLEQNYYPPRDRRLSPMEAYQTTNFYRPQYRNDSLEKQENYNEKFPNKNFDNKNYRSPNTINYFDNNNNIDYNLRTLKARKSPKNFYTDELEYQQNNNIYDKNDYQNTYENKYYKSTYAENSPNIFINRNLDNKDSPQFIDRRGNTYTIIPPSGGTVRLNRNISLNNFDEINSSLNDIENRRNSQEQKNNFNLSYYNNLHTYNNYTVNNNNTRYAPQTINNLNVISENTFPQKDEIHNKYFNKTYENMTYKDVKKIVRRFTKVYDPNKNTNGLLLENSQITLPGATDDIFNNRFRVLAKMNRLSNILLSKKKNSPKKKENLINYIDNIYVKNSNSVDDMNRSFNRHSLEKNSKSPLKMSMRKSPENKFKYVSLAMISSKGLKTEDRIIFRRMRFEKGGVVDLAQEARNKKKKYKIRKVSRSPGLNKSSINPKYREKAARLIQSWWKEIKAIYNKRLKSIILIQSVYRGRFVRKYMYDLLYLNYLYLSFCQKIENVLRKKIKPYVFYKLKNENAEIVSYEEEQDFNILKNLVASKAKKWKIINLRFYFKKWKNIIKKNEKLILALFKLLRIRAENEKLHWVLREALRRWKYLTRIQNLMERLEKEPKEVKKIYYKEYVENTVYEKEEEEKDIIIKESNSKKIMGLLKILDGSSKIIKKNSLNVTQPKISKYLLKNCLENKLKNMIKNKTRMEKNLLRKYLYLYLNNTLKKRHTELKIETKEQINSLKDSEKKLMDIGKNQNKEMEKKLKNIKARILLRLIETVQNKQNKNILQKKIHQFYRNATKLARNTEKSNFIKQNNEINNLNEKNIKEIVKLTKIINETSVEKTNVIEKLKIVENNLKNLEKKYADTENENEKLRNRKPEKEIVEKIVEKVVEKENPINKENEKLAASRQEEIDKLLKEKDDLMNKIKKIEEENERYKKMKNDLLSRHKGSQILERYVIKKTYKYILYAIKENLRKKTINSLLNKMLKLKNRTKKYLLKKYLDKWRNNAFNKTKKEKNNKLFVKILSVIIDYLLKNKLRKKLYHWYKIATNKPEPEVLKNNIFKVIKILWNLKDKIRKKSINQVGKNFLTNLKKTRNPEFLKKLLKKLLLKKILKNKIKLRHAFNIWRLNANRGKNIFLLKSKIVTTICYKYKNINKKLLNKYFDRWKTNTLLNKFADDLYKTNQISKNKNLVYLKTLLKNLNKSHKNNLLKKYFNKWKNLLLKTKKILPGLLNNITKKNIKKNGPQLIKNLNILSNIDKRNDLLKKFIPKKTKQNKLLLYHYLLRWKNKMFEIRASTAYLPYRNLVLAILLTKNDKSNLMRAFLKWRYTKQILAASKGSLNLAMKLLKLFSVKKPFIKFYTQMRKTNPKILKPKGTKLIKTLENIIEKKPFENFINKLKLYIRTEKLKDIQPKIHDKLKKYLLKKYLNRWKDNAKKIKDQKLKIIQNWIKRSAERFTIQKNQRKNELLKHLISNITKDNKFKLKFPLHCWKHITGVLTDNDNARLIQDFCRFVLLKIKYRDAKKMNKLADLFQKYFQKTIINKITEKTTVTKVQEFIHQKRDNKNKLRHLFNDIDRKNKKRLLRKILKKWLNRNTAYDNKLITIQNSFRIILAKKKLENLKKLKNILLKLHHLKELHKINKLRYTLLKWLTNVNKLKCFENAKIIQKYIRRKLHIIKQDKNLAVVQLNKVLGDIILRCAFNSMKKKHKKEKVRVSLIKQIIELDDKNNKDILKNYFDKWKDIVMNLKNKENDDATKIQKNFLGYLMRKKINNILNRNNKLKNLINKHDNNNLLKFAFARWKRIIKVISCNENAKIIQKFCRKILSKLERNKFNKNKNNYENLANVLSKIGIKPRLNALDKIKNLYRNVILSDLLNNLNKNRLDKLQTVNDKLKNYSKLKKLLSVITNLENFKFKILKNAINKWRDNAIRRKNIELNLRKILGGKDNLTNDLLRCALLKWLKKAHNIKYKGNGNIIKNFCEKVVAKIRAIKNWKNLSEKLRNLKNKDQKNELLKKLKILGGLKKLSNKLKNKIQKDVFKKLNKNYYLLLFIKKIREIINKLDDNSNDNLIKRYFHLYKTIVRKIRERDEKTDKMLNILDKYQYHKNVNALNNVNIIKKLLGIIPYAQKKIALNKIKNFVDNKIKIINLADGLINAKNDFYYKKITLFANKLYKIYVHKILDNLFNYLQKQRIKNAKPSKIKLITILKMRLNKAKDFTYSNKHKKEVKPFTKKLKFQVKKSTTTNIKPKSYKRNNYLSLTPTLINYLNSLIKNRKKNILEKIKKKSKAEFLCKVLKKYVYEKEKPNFSEFLENIKYITDFMKHAGPQKMKLFKLLRKTYIKRLLIHKEEINRMSNIFYLLNLTEYQKQQSLFRWIRKIIRKWRFLSFVKKMTKKKMELMYKNMHLNYLELVNTVFSDDEEEISPSVIKEFERFGVDVGMFENESPYTERESKFCKGVKKQYIFDSIDLPKRTKTVIEEEKFKKIETIEKPIDIDSENYDSVDGNMSNRDKKIGGRYITSRVNRYGKYGNDYSKDSIEMNSRRKRLQDSNSRIKDSELNDYEENSEKKSEEDEKK